MSSSPTYEKLNSGAFRGGRVIAPDSKFTGEEPTWLDVKDWDVEKFLHERGRAMRFYNYYLELSDFKKATLQWMTNVGYDQKDIDTIQSAPPYVPEAIAGKIARCLIKGMPGAHEEAGTNDEKTLREKISEALRDTYSGRYTSKKAPVKVDSTAPSPQERMRVKISQTVMGDLEAMLDKWIELGNEKVIPLNLYSTLEAHDVPGQGMGQVMDWVKKVLAEFEEVAEGKCEQLKEAYGHLSKTSLKSRIDGLRSMLGDAIKYTQSKKAMRKPRAKKVKSAEKQVERIKYLPGSKEFGLTSVSPSSIPGAYKVYIFNVKYKTLSWYVASSPSGLSIKGTTLKGISEKESWTQALRKPNMVLPVVLGKTDKQIEKTLVELTTKKRPGNGRINSDTIILRVIDHK